MLVEHYPLDKRFEEIARHFPKMDARLEKIDRYLEDETLYRLIKNDLSKRWPKTEETGRNSTPVEVVLRMLVVKRLYGYSYEETLERVRDSLSLRRFCRVYFNDVPVDTTLIRWANLIQPKTLEKFNERIIQLAVERKVTNGRKLRTDGTVVESNIRPPSDNRLLADGVRVLARTVVRARQLVKQVMQEPFEDFTQTAKQLARQIGETLRKKTEAAKRAGRQQYQELLEMTRKTMAWASATKQHLQSSCDAKAQRLAQTLETFLPRTQQVIDQTVRRILQSEQVPASEKIVSLFEEHTDIIRRGKESRPVEYGHKVWLNEVEGGLVSHYRILNGNPNDEQQWKPSLKAHLKTFHQPPHQVSGDRGLFSEENEKLAVDLGVKRVILPKRGYRSKARLKHEHKKWFVKGRHWHAGVEGRISVLQRAHNFARCLAHGLTGFHCWVGWGVIAGNLAVLGRT
ncbi:MAG TPA: ISNCY family transposase [Anaerolineales bacterium]|nr:ISNCY family transposase [Anaerolineales bacterium]